MSKRKFPKIENLTKLDIGCANKKRSGFVGLDIKDWGQEIVWDVRDGIPVPDESIEYIYTCHFLEHLTNQESVEFFKEVYRVLKKEGIFEAWLPHGSAPEAFYPDHHSFWNEQRVSAMCHDVYQKSGLWSFEIIENKKVGNQLYFKLKKR